MLIQQQWVWTTSHVWLINWTEAFPEANNTQSNIQIFYFKRAYETFPAILHKY